MNDITDIFAARLREKRRKLGLTQKALAEKLGYSEKAISKWESGAGLPPTVLLPRLAEVLLTGIDELLSPPTGIRYFLGIDGGGTKTEFVLADQNGTVHKRTVLGTSNPNDVGLSQTLEVLHSGILEACGTLPRQEISVFAGIAGGITGTNKERIAEALAQYHFGKAENGSDAESAVAASLGKRNGVTVIMGTGTIAFAQNDCSLHRVGGFGYLFGDEGSGFAIGRDGILAALKDESGYGEKTLLTRLVREKCGGETILGRLSDFYAGGKRTVASYAPLVFEAFGMDDPAAQKIIHTNIAAIAELIVAASRYVNEERVIRVALCGGISRYYDTHLYDAFLPMLKEQLGADREKYEIDVCRRSTVYGALLLAGMEDTNNAENRSQE